MVHTYQTCSSSYTSCLQEPWTICDVEVTFAYPAYADKLPQIFNSSNEQVQGLTDGDAHAATKGVIVSPRNLYIIHMLSDELIYLLCTIYSVQILH